MNGDESESPRLDSDGERSRIVAAVLEVVTTSGFQADTLEIVLERASLNDAAFRRHFDDLQDCSMQMYAGYVEDFNRAVFGALQGSDAVTWRDRLRVAAYAAAYFFFDHLPEVRFCVIGLQETGEMAQVKREAHLQLMVDLIDAARQELDDPDSTSRATAESVVGSIFGVLTKEIGRPGGVRTPEAVVPELMFIAVRPYFGHETASEEIRMPPPDLSAHGHGPPGQRVDVAQKQSPKETEGNAQGGLVSGYLPPVAKEKPSEGDERSEPAGLSRLPPGRHGLPRSFVVQNQRDRLVAGIIAAVAEHGYHETTITQIAAGAGMSRRTFYTYFSSKQECYLATYDLIASHLAEAARAAAASREDWSDRVRAQLAAALDFFAANPDLVRFYLIAPPRAGEEIAARYRLGASRVLAELTDRMPPEARQPTQAIQDALAGGMAGLIVAKVEAGEGKRLPELLPDLTELFLTPYMGREAASSAAREAS